MREYNDLSKRPGVFIDRDEVESILREYVRQKTGKEIQDSDIDYEYTYYGEDRYLNGFYFIFAKDKCDKSDSYTGKRGYRPFCCIACQKKWDEVHNKV